MTAEKKNAENEVLETFHEFYQSWANREHRDDVEILLDKCDPGVTVIGSAAHELLVGVDEYRQMILEDLVQAPGILEVSFPWCRVKVLGDVGIVEAELDLKIPVEGSLQEIGPLYITQIYRHGKDRWLMEHCHMSFPSADQTDEEVWPTEALKARNLELERLVANRTESLNQKTEDLQKALLELKAAQAQLIQSEKMASLGQLTAGIAHEIKNPLNFVNNFAEVSQEMADELVEAIKTGNETSAQSIAFEISENSSQIAKHGKRADSIVRSMMQHARGGTSVHEHVPVVAFLEEQIKLAWHGRRAKDQSFRADVTRDFDEDLGEIRIQSMEMGRVILNLLNNAFDAVSNSGNASITVAARCADDGVQIEVRDNGPGIAKEDQDKIFEPFFTTKPSGSGTGLGLSLSYDIVTQAHGGVLKLNDTLENGAEFIIWLPSS